MLPQNSLVRASIGPITSGSNGEGAGGSRPDAADTSSPVSAKAFTIAARTSAGFAVGTIRQFTDTSAVCGSALIACPPFIMVGTQVVRNVEL